jgi:D-3-phosphoglycerate dehydrogenase
VSNYVLGNILVITSGLYQNQIIKSPTWRNEIPKGLEGSIIGIVGLGRIGLVLLNKLIQFPFLKIYVNDIFDLDFEQIIPERYRDRVEQVDLETCLSNSDIVTLHVPLTTTTKNLINEEVLSVMTKTSWLINTSRGEIIDEVALYNALTNQTLGGAVLDVFAEEPYDGPLIGIPNAVLTPHIGTYNLHARREMESFLVNKALDFSLECSDLNFVERL